MASTATKHRGAGGSGAREPAPHRGHQQQRSHGRRESNSSSKMPQTVQQQQQQTKPPQPVPPVQQKPFAWGTPKMAPPPAVPAAPAAPAAPAQTPVTAAASSSSSSRNAIAPTSAAPPQPPAQPKPFAWGAPKMAPAAPVPAATPAATATASAPATDAVDLFITFGDFTPEETVKVLQEDESEPSPSDADLAESSAAASAPAPLPPMTKSWAEALGVVTPKDEPPAPAWGAVAAPAPAKSGAEPVPFEFAIQEALRSLDIAAPGQEMKKRGLVNQGNTCFQNVILQSLLACAPFLNMLVDISSAVAPTSELLAAPSSFKAWRHIVAFIREFEEPVLGSLMAKPEPSKLAKSIRISGYFLDVLSEFQQMRGEQEDALEFLEFFLDYLHCEYEQSGLALPPSCEQQTKRTAPRSSSDVSDTLAAALADDEWAEVGKRGKSSVLRQNHVDASRSPINWLFKGALRSELKQSGKKQSSITIEPFHCLHLNLELESANAAPASSPLLATTATPPAATTGAFAPGTSGLAKPPASTYSIDDMLRKAFAVEVIEGAHSSPAMKRFTSIETLPVVLTLNIKRFTYHPELGPVKLQQFVQYPNRFEFPAQFLSSTCRAENSVSGELTGGNASGDSSADGGVGPRFSNPPVYELFAVVSHHGKFVVGGHYTCVCRDNKDQWFRFDDEHVASIAEATALAENAYLLFYIRSNASVTPESVGAAMTAAAASASASAQVGKKPSPKAKSSVWGQQPARPIPGMSSSGGAKTAASGALNVNAPAFSLAPPVPGTGAVAAGGAKKAQQSKKKKHVA